MHSLNTSIKKNEMSHNLTTILQTVQILLTNNKNSVSYILYLIFIWL